jgi:UDP-N-acetylglucosamine 2-epimerase (non-hydrolysing)
VSAALSKATSRVAEAAIAYIVGARPNFVKMAPVLARLRDRLPDVRHVLVHTGQPYDPEMSELLFEELGIPQPDYLLGVGSGSHATQTARVRERLEPVLDRTMPEEINRIVADEFSDLLFVHCDEATANLRSEDIAESPLGTQEGAHV